MRAPCGIDCAACDIYKAAQSRAKAERLAEAWRAWQPKAEAQWFRCRGCRGDRSVCWTEECRIFECVTSRKHEFCSDCPDFPCDLLTAWAEESPNHKEALGWLLRPDTKP